MLELLISAVTAVMTLLMIVRYLGPHGIARCLMLVALAELTLLAFSESPLQAQNKLRVVATLPTYAAITRELTGDLAEIDAIARGDEDAHFVQPRPSFAAKLGKADMFVSTGLDLELWVPAVIDRARNPKIVEGGPGNVVAYSGIQMLEVP